MGWFYRAVMPPLSDDQSQKILDNLNEQAEMIKRLLAVIENAEGRVMALELRQANQDGH